MFGILALGAALLALPAHANVKTWMPDFYAEPGLHPFRDPVQANVTEHIDPFSVVLNLTYVDLFIPGNGGFDIRIQRSYNSSNIYYGRKTSLNIAPYLTILLPRSPFGLGWTIHLGRVLKSEDLSAGGVFGICNDGGPGDDTLNNAMLELHDGSQQILFVNSTSFSARFITRDQWVADRISGGLLVISPEGVKYTMNRHVAATNLYDSNIVDHAWYPTRIEDRNGNYLTISYLSTTSHTHALISSISARDGRSVSFGYANASNPSAVLLTSISANGQTWQYQYTALSGYTGGYYLLTRVRRPGGSDWEYT